MIRPSVHPPYSLLTTRYSLLVILPPTRMPVVAAM